jgi:GAF domain-containing protein
MAITITEAEAQTFEKTPLISQLLTEWITGEQSQGLALANYANASAILFENIKSVNWAGFYFYDEKLNELVLGPFVGKPAVVRIQPGKGVVGNAFVNQETVVVADVHTFDGHIVCDPASNAEIVVPLTTADGKQLGVLDIDSTALNRFGIKEKAEIEHFVRTLLQYV